MADRKITELTALTGANTQDTDVLVIVDTSANETKKITLGELENALAERDFSFGDNDKLTFGASSDLQIYHTGSASRIQESGQGNLYIAGTNLQLTNADISDNYLQAVDGGATTIYYAGDAKLATTSTGVDITGTLTSDGLTVDGTSLVNGSGTITSGGSAGIDTRLTLANTGNGGAGRGVALSLSPAGSSNSVESVSLIGLQESVSATANNSSFVAQVANSSGTLTQRLRINNGGDISFYEDTGTTAKMTWHSSDETLAIGVTANRSNAPLAVGFKSSADWNYGDTNSYYLPSGNAAITMHGAGGVDNWFGMTGGYNQSSGSANLLLMANNRNTTDQAGNYIGSEVQTATKADLTFGKMVGGSAVDGNSSKSEHMRIDSSGNVGIGNTIPSAFYTDANNLVVGSASGSNGITVYTATTGLGALYFADGTTGTDEYRGGMAYSHNATEANEYLALVSGGASKMWIKPSGYVGIGTSSPSEKLHIYSTSTGNLYPMVQNTTAGNAGWRLKNSQGDWVMIANDALRFYDHGQSQERARIDSSGNLIVGGTTDGAASSITLQHDGDIRGVLASGAGGDTLISAISGVSNGYQIVVDTSNNQSYRWHNGGTRSMTLDSSGNLLVGTTSLATYNLSSGGGSSIPSGGGGFFARANDNVIVANRTGSDGGLVQFRKDGTTVGSIGVASSAIHLGNQDTGIRFAGGSDAIQPWNTGTNAARDAAIDIGTSSARFKDLYLSGGVKAGTGQRTTFAAGGFYDNAADGNNTGVMTGGNQIFISDGTGSATDNERDIGATNRRIKDIYVGGGVYLGGTDADHKLDYFEKGSTTVSLRGATEPATLITATMYWRRIDDQVFFQVGFEQVDTTGYSGAMSITSLPFANTSGSRAMVHAGLYNSGTWTDTLMGVIGTSSTTIDFQNLRSGNTWQAVNHSAGTNRYIWVTGSYMN